MIELPTPETDALFWRNGYPVVVASSKAMQLCEKLEQERDWITEKFKLLEGCFNRAERERDEALERERVAILSFDEERQRALREGERVLEARRERDEARAERDILRSNKMSDPLLETTFKHLNRERDEACQVANGLAKQVERLRKQRDEAREELENEMKWHHQTHKELIEAQCKLLDIEYDKLKS